MVNSFKYNLDGTGIIEATFHPDLKPYLLQLKNRFLMYDMKHVLNISSSNSIRMYELLKAFEGIGKRTFEISELKEILGVEDKYNHRYYNFKKRIILQAQKDLAEHTDICFTIKETKLPGTKKVDKITFFIVSNLKKDVAKKRDSSVQKPLFEADEGMLKGGLKRLNKYKFSPVIIEKEILGKYDADYIESTLKHCENYFKQSNIPNKEGFILTALSKKYYVDEILKEKNKAEERAKKKQQSIQEGDLKQKYHEYILEQVEIAKNKLSSNKLEQLKVDFLEKMKDNSFFTTALNAYGFEHKIINGQRQLFLRDRLLSSEQKSYEIFVDSL